jgi:hypothetical protein
VAIDAVIGNVAGLLPSGYAIRGSQPPFSALHADRQSSRQTSHYIVGSAFRPYQMQRKIASADEIPIGCHKDRHSLQGQSLQHGVVI